MSKKPGFVDWQYPGGIPCALELMAGSGRAARYEPEEWNGATWGRSEQFFATDEEVQDLLLTALPAKYAPYTVIGYTNVMVERRARDVFAECDVGDFLLLRKQGVTEFFDMFFIKSQVISPDINLIGRRHIGGVLGIHGLISLHHGGIHHRVGWGPSNFGLMHRIEHRRTGERVAHHDYDKVFFALRRAVKKRGRYRTLYVQMDGEEVEAEHIHMTEGFVAALRAGEIESRYYPGDPLS